ncbi:TPA: hypothetical protein NM870_003579 [Acinetobacter baumannii]|nr:hypothetical protein [Acinetobacter baumannii]
MEIFDSNAKLKQVFVVGSVPSISTTFLPIISTVNQVLNKDLPGLNIITTTHSEHIQYYGWKSPIDEHQDNSGYIFFMPINIESEDVLIVEKPTNDPKVKETERIKLEVGTIYAINDRIPHSTEGNGRVVAAFLGPVNKKFITEDYLLKTVIPKFTDACMQVE